MVQSKIRNQKKNQFVFGGDFNATSTVFLSIRTYLFVFFTTFVALESHLSFSTSRRIYKLSVQVCELFMSDRWDNCSWRLSMIFNASGSRLPSLPQRLSQGLTHKSPVAAGIAISFHDLPLQSSFSFICTDISANVKRKAFDDI